MTHFCLEFWMCLLNFISFFFTLQPWRTSFSRRWWSFVSRTMPLRRSSQAGKSAQVSLWRRWRISGIFFFVSLCRCVSLCLSTFFPLFVLSFTTSLCFCPFPLLYFVLVVLSLSFLVFVFLLFFHCVCLFLSFFSYIFLFFLRIFIYLFIFVFNLYKCYYYYHCIYIFF